VDLCRSSCRGFLAASYGTAEWTVASPTVSFLPSAASHQTSSP
jgi:hypothetical protein